jgi:hypothetical protein
VGFAQIIITRRRNNYVRVKKKSLLSAVERNFLKMKKIFTGDFLKD